MQSGKCVANVWLNMASGMAIVWDKVASAASAWLMSSLPVDNVARASNRVAGVWLTISLEAHS